MAYRMKGIGAPPKRIMARKLKLAHARQLREDIAQVLRDAEAHNAARETHAPVVDPDPEGKFQKLVFEANLRVESEVWRKRAKRPKF